MVAQGLIALALALPTGMLFGVGYGTGVRIGYEQVYPLLFPKATGSQPNADEVKSNLKQINSIYDTIGGKEASNMGIAQGLNSIRAATENNPDFHYLEELELKMSGHTPSNSVNPNSTPTTDSSPLPASSDTTIERVFQIRQMTDIAKMVRNLAQEEAKFIKDLNVIQAYRDRINLLRKTPTTTETIQEKQQRELAEREQPPPAPYREATSREQLRTQFRVKESELMGIIITYKNRAEGFRTQLEQIRRLGVTKNIRLQTQYKSDFNRYQKLYSNAKKTLYNYYITAPTTLGRDVLDLANGGRNKLNTSFKYLAPI